jgi:hypothetical protein
MDSNQTKYLFYDKIINVETIKAMSLAVQEVSLDNCNIGANKWGPIMEALSQK